MTGKKVYKSFFHVFKSFLLLSFILGSLQNYSGCITVIINGQ